MAAVALSRGNSNGWDLRVGGLCGILLGILLIATFAVTYNFPAAPSEADATLAGFSSFRAAFIAADIFTGLAAVCAIPYFLALRKTFPEKESVGVGSATLLAIAGIVVTAVVLIGEEIALDVLSDAYATAGATRTAAIVVAQAVIGFSAVEVFGFLVLAAGFAVYGFATRHGRPFPRWLGYLVIVGAILSLVSALPVSGAFLGIVGGAILILVWIFFTSASLIRSGTPRSAP